jgi:hypothetical protein
VGSIVNPSDAASEGSDLDHGLVDGGLTTLGTQSPDVDELSTFQRSKRVHIQRDIGVQGDGGCSEDGCKDSTDARLMVQCAGPGYSLMVSYNY